MATKNQVKALDNFGTDKSKFIQEGQLDVLDQLAGEFIKRVKANLQKEDMIVSGEIADIQIQKTTNGIELTANKSLIYQDAGVNGSKIRLYDTPYSYKTKRPPIEPFIEWVKRRNINARNNKKYYGKESSFKNQQPEAVAYAIRESVFQKGIKPTKVYSREIPKLIDDVADGLADFIVNTIVK